MMRTLFEMGASARFVLDARGRVLKRNSAARHLFAFAPKQQRDLPAILDGFRDLLGDPGAEDEWAGQIGALEALLASRSGQMTLRGQSRALDLNLHPLFDDLVVLELEARLRPVGARSCASDDLALMSEMLEFVEEGVVVYDLDEQGREIVASVNQAALRILEVEAEAIHVGMTREAVARIAFANGLRSAFSDVDSHVDHLLSSPGREVVVCMASGSRGLLINRPRAGGGSITICTDLTQRREDRQKLRENEVEYRALAESAPTGIVKIDEDGGILFANPAAEELFDCAAEEIDLHARLRAGDGRSAKAHLRESRRFEAEISAAYQNKHVIVSVSEAIESKGGKLRIVTFADITALKEARRRIEFLARHDALTGLGNRTLLQASWSQIEAQPRGAPVHFVALDLDRFKKVNDDHGHANGDKLLKLAANRILFELPDEAQAFRLGGDEFGILLRGGDREEAVETARRIVTALSHPFEIEGSYATIGCSAGVATLHADGRDGESVQRAADVALYKVKRNGRDGVAVYDAALECEIMERQRLETDLALAVAHNELQLLFQPELNLASGEIVGVEALVLWHNRRLQADVPRAVYAEVAAACGLASVIDFWAVRGVLAQIRRFDEEGIALPRISVNISPTTLVQSNTTRRLVEGLRQNGLEPGRLQIEIDETGEDIEKDKLVRSLDEIRAAGIAITFDKVGREHRLFEHVAARRMNGLKLDSSFTRRIGTDATARAVVGAFLRMCAELDVETTLCGIDDEESLAAALGLGSLRTQGTMVAAPETAEALSARFAATPRALPSLRAAG